MLIPLTAKNQLIDEFVTYLADAGGGAGDEDDFAGDFLGEEVAEDGEEELVKLKRWQEKQEGEEGEGRCHQIQELVDQIHGFFLSLAERQKTR